MSTPADLGLELRAEADQDARVAAALARERPRLLQWLRRHLADRAEVEDLLQDVFYELVLAYRLAKPIEQVGAWLFRVARNRLTDRFRRRRAETPLEATAGGEEGAPIAWQELLPSLAPGPDADYTRTVLAEEIEAALGELPAEQRAVFLAHEVEGLSFREMAARSGVGINTLLSRKHYAVLHLRQRLQAVYDEFLAG